MCQPCLCIFCVSDALRPRGFADPGGTTRSADSWAWKPPRVSYANLSIQMESDSQPNPLLFSGSLRPGHHPPVLISAGQVRTSGAALAAQSSEAASVPFGARNGGSVSYLPPLPSATSARTHRGGQRCKPVTESGNRGRNPAAHTNLGCIRTFRNPPPVARGSDSLWGWS